MSTLNINVSEHVKAIVDEQVRNGGFPSESDYLCRLIEADENRRAQVAVESLLIARIEDSRTVVMDDADWTQMRQEFLGRIAN